MSMNAYVNVHFVRNIWELVNFVIQTEVNFSYSKSIYQNQMLSITK